MSAMTPGAGAGAAALAARAGQARPSPSAPPSSPVETASPASPPAAVVDAAAPAEAPPAAAEVTEATPAPANRGARKGKRKRKGPGKKPIPARPTGSSAPAEPADAAAPAAPPDLAEPPVLSGEYPASTEQRRFLAARVGLNGDGPRSTTEACRLARIAETAVATWREDSLFRAWECEGLRRGFPELSGQALSTVRRLMLEDADAKVRLAAAEVVLRMTGEISDGKGKNGNGVPEEDAPIVVTWGDGTY